MREIKFRAWDMTTGLMIDWGMVRQLQFASLDGHYLKFMQYTGLSDKNGVEIYGGDIVRYKDGIAAIEFNVTEGSWYASNDNANLRYIVDFGGEVIGNIYQNPELLKDGDAQS
jgi:uncharacterized phage protein (TIGR01671 family)